MKAAIAILGLLILAGCAPDPRVREIVRLQHDVAHLEKRIAAIEQAHAIADGQ